MAFAGPPDSKGPAVLPAHADRRLTKYLAGCPKCNWTSEDPKEKGRLHVMTTGHAVIETRTYEVVPR